MSAGRVGSAPALVAALVFALGWVLAPATFALAQQPPLPPPAAPPAVAAEPVEPLVGPPILQIATASAVSPDPFGSVSHVRELPGGRLLVNDATRRRLLLMDSTLTVLEVVLDSLSEVANTYGPRPGALVPYRADSTLFVDPASFAAVVIDPEGQVVRVRSVWRPEHVIYYTSTTGLYGWPGLDARGRIVYRIPAVPAPPAVAPPPGLPYFPPVPDSTFLVAVDLDTRALDTIGVVRTPLTERNIRRTAEGSFMIETVVNPLPATDGWGVLPDGTVAFVRATDYRIDYLNPDGSWSSSEKLPYEWHQLTDADKSRIVDSTRVAQERLALTSYVTSVIRWVNMYGRGYPEDFEVPEGYAPGPGFPSDWILPPGVTFPPNYIYACPPGEEPSVTTVANPAAPTGVASMPSCLPSPLTISGGSTPPPPVRRPVAVMRPSELPDYRPPLPNAAVHPDLDGNLWIRTVQPRPVPGGFIYDVVSREGELTTRLQLPQGYTLVGFGRGGVVYLSMRDPTGVKLARVQLR